MTDDFDRRVLSTYISDLFMDEVVDIPFYKYVIGLWICSNAENCVCLLLALVVHVKHISHTFVACMRFLLVGFRCF